MTTANRALSILRRRSRSEGKKKLPVRSFMNMVRAEYAPSYGIATGGRLLGPDGPLANMPI